MLFALFFQKFSNPSTFLQRPSTVELALDISSGSRYWLVYYTYYLSTYCAIAIEFPNLTVYRNGIEKNCDGQFISPDARYVLK